MAARGYELHPVWEVGNTDVITRFLLKNKGISFLPEYVVGDYIRDGKLAVLNTECEEIHMWSQLVYHKNKYVTPQMNQFIETMLNICMGLVQRTKCICFSMLFHENIRYSVRAFSRALSMASKSMREVYLFSSS